MKEVTVGEENPSKQNRYQQIFSETSGVGFQDVNGKYVNNVIEYFNHKSYNNRIFFLKTSMYTNMYIEVYLKQMV